MDYYPSICYLRRSSLRLEEELSCTLGKLGYPFTGVDFSNDDPATHLSSHDLFILPVNENITDFYHSLNQLDSIHQQLLVVAPQESDVDTQIIHQCADFFFWPCQPSELDLRIRRVTPQNITEGEMLPCASRFLAMNLVGRAPRFMEALSKITRFATCEIPALIEGETGTGKELAARALHYLGARAGKPFVPVNCGALPEFLFENELFGHKAGAYTDGRREMRGLIAEAEGGTLFLDEVETLSYHGQAALLRFLQNGEYRQLGGGPVRKSNVRIIAASNSPLQKCIAEKSFRSDLFYRLNVAQIHMPALRCRPGDAHRLAQYFLQRINSRTEMNRRFTPLKLAWIESQPWLGNVRELENYVETQAILNDNPTIDLNNSTDLTPKINSLDSPQSFQEAKAQAINTFEEGYLRKIMDHAGGNISIAARYAGKERCAFRRLLKKHGIQRTDFLPDP